MIFPFKDTYLLGGHPSGNSTIDAGGKEQTIGKLAGPAIELVTKTVFAFT
jgi:hypothetical protein